jgi:hypothetical protein
MLNLLDTIILINILLLIMTLEIKIIKTNFLDFILIKISNICNCNIYLLLIWSTKIHTSRKPHACYIWS